jgi:transcriptional regulator with AAA-type ATPase domain
VAELPLTMQVKLLRAIQEKRVRKVGATGEEAVDVRSSAPPTRISRHWSSRGDSARTCSIG